MAFFQFAMVLPITRNIYKIVYRDGIWYIRELCSCYERINILTLTLRLFQDLTKRFSIISVLNRLRNSQLTKFHRSNLRNSLTNPFHSLFPFPFEVSSETKLTINGRYFSS